MKEIGRGSVSGEGTNDYFTSVRIDDEYQRQGIATELYNTVEKHLGKKLKPSPLAVSPKAEAFWASRTPSEKWAFKEGETRFATIGDSTYKDYGLKSPTLSEESLQAVRSYTQGTFREINRRLREGEPLSLEQDTIVKELDKSIKEYGTLSKPVTVWRGIKTDNYLDTGIESTLKHYEGLVGKETKLPGFQSTSFDPEVSLNHSQGKRSGGVLFEIQTDKGILLDKSVSSRDDESEFLLGHDWKYKVVGVERRAPIETLSGDHVHVDVVKLKVIQ